MKNFVNERVIIVKYIFLLYMIYNKKYYYLDTCNYYSNTEG